MRTTPRITLIVSNPSVVLLTHQRSPSGGLPLLEVRPCRFPK